MHRHAQKDPDKSHRRGIGLHQPLGVPLPVQLLQPGVDTGGGGPEADYIGLGFRIILALISGAVLLATRVAVDGSIIPPWRLNWGCNTLPRNSGVHS